MATTEIILYEHISKLGDIGDIVKVRTGYARNYLFPLGKALRNSKKNREYFEAKKQYILAENLKKKQSASVIHKIIDGKELIFIVNTSDSGQLYGSVNRSVIASKLLEMEIKIDRNNILLSHPFKSVGIYEVGLSLHSDVVSKIKLNIARSEQEALDQRSAGVKGVAEEFFAKAKALEEAKLKERKEKEANERKEAKEKKEARQKDSKPDSSKAKETKQSKSAEENTEIENSSEADSELQKSVQPDKESKKSD